MYRDSASSVVLFNNQWTLQLVKFLIGVGFASVGRVARCIGMGNAQLVFEKSYCDKF
jgi:uncharacterized protein YerC